MSALSSLPREPANFTQSRGLLGHAHFQMAYTTNDIEQAWALFSTSLGLRDYSEIGGPTADGGHITARLAWLDTVMYEIIEATGPSAALYNGRLPQGEGFAIQHHHLGFCIPDEEEWQALLTQAQQSPWPIVSQTSNPLMDVCFVDCTALGHYLEYLHPNENGMAFFNAVPRN